jgi:hypothetical protein
MSWTRPKPSPASLSLRDRVPYAGTFAVICYSSSTQAASSPATSSTGPMQRHPTRPRARVGLKTRVAGGLRGCLGLGVHSRLTGFALLIRARRSSVTKFLLCALHAQLTLQHAPLSRRRVTLHALPPAPHARPMLREERKTTQSTLSPRWCMVCKRRAAGSFLRLCLFFISQTVTSSLCVRSLAGCLRYAAKVSKPSTSNPRPSIPRPLDPYIPRPLHPYTLHPTPLMETSSSCARCLGRSSKGVTKR